MWSTGIGCMFCARTCSILHRCHGALRIRPSTSERKVADCWEGQGEMSKMETLHGPSQPTPLAGRWRRGRCTFETNTSRSTVGATWLLYERWRCLRAAMLCYLHHAYTDSSVTAFADSQMFSRGAQIVLVHKISPPSSSTPTRRVHCEARK